MSYQVIKNGCVITPFKVRFTNVWIKDGIISHLQDQYPSQFADRKLEEIDARNCYVTPGLVDLQVNGSQDCDLWDLATEESLSKLSKTMAEHGVTTYLPTLITADIDHLVENQKRLSNLGVGDKAQLSATGRDNQSARMPGIHLEGPCISKDKPGVHPPDFIIPPSENVFKKLVGEAVLLVTMACEEDKSGKAASWLMDSGIHVSLGHSNATFEEASSAFDSGVHLVTHLFNAMSPLHHRAPGLPGAALADEKVKCCLIPDGLHVNRQMVKMAYRLKGEENLILVTDIAHVGTKDGDLVGSSITLDTGVRNMIEWEICQFSEAIKMASINPAKAIGLSDSIGSIEPGKLADIVIWNRKDLNIDKVLIGGN